ncbi:MAG: acetoacetate--CoA ligase [Chloroflexaceae bacterium]|nr:acetoacetate--CoA ligase [Chloroflexaceae bacterium]
MDIPPILWQPTPAFQQQTTLAAYQRWLAEQRGLELTSYETLWRWSVEQIEDFWASLWDFFNIAASTPYETVLSSRVMPGAQWFVGAQLNLARHVFRQVSQERPAILAESELRPLTAFSWADLIAQTAAVATALRTMGVSAGDRVVAVLPNIPETVVAFLACASIGAIWSSSSPDFGVTSIVDRFRQIEPKVLLIVDGYRYGGRDIDCRPMQQALREALPSLQQTIVVPYLFGSPAPSTLHGAFLWDDMVTQTGELAFTEVSAQHPLWVLYSSGTTGLPKPIVHSHGGILLELLKGLALHLDLKAGDRFFWFSTTGWMMWNFLLGGLLLGCTIILYDGNPGYPDMGKLWDLAERTNMTFFGTGAPYINACRKAGLRPAAHYDLQSLKGVGSTASPLPPEGFDWVYEQVKADILLASISGGTDVCTAFVGSCPLLPVHRGEIQCAWLGALVAAFDEQGQSVVDTVGEFVVCEPMPSMPIFFWNDPEMLRYRASYFAQYPGIWRHGDWVRIRSQGGLVISGRSDSTINRMGIRMGTSELYRAIEALAEIRDSLVVDIARPERDGYMPLFVVLADGVALDEALIMRIKQQIRTTLSPRHVPDDVFAIAEVPYTLSGKKLEVPVKRLLQGEPLERIANPDSMRNPGALAVFVELATRLSNE